MQANKCKLKGIVGVLYAVGLFFAAGCGRINSSSNVDSSINNSEQSTVNSTSSKPEIPEVDFSMLTYCAYGDSITWGYDAYKLNGTERMDSPYPTAVADTLDFASFDNMGVSGATLVKNTVGLECISDIVIENDKKYDIISLLGGVNDFQRDLPLGTSSDTTQLTVYGALDVIARDLRAKNPSAFIFFMTPFKYSYYGKSYLAPNNAGYMLSEVADAVKIVAQRYGFPVLDLYNEGGFEDCLSGGSNPDPRCDGIHPSQEFVLNRIAPQITEFVEENYE